MSQVVLITGISSGFGKAVSTLLAHQGYKVYGTFRTPCEYDPLVHAMQLDVTDQPGVKKCIDTVLEKEGHIDLLINNAGMHTGGPVEMIPDEMIRLQLETNFMGMVYTIRNVLPSMRRQGRGTIVNISSIGGLMGLPFQGYYSAAKFAVEGMSDALRMELRPFHIRVIVINPGDFHTRNTANRQKFLADKGDGSYEMQFRKTLSVIEKDETNGWPPDVLARQLYRILQKRRPADRYIIASAEQKLAVMLKNILPDSWFSAILRAHYGIK
jgi:NAD(P)-dependent dehydrogenase (short-subunit alcohol dehydrogenase family)